MYNFNAFWVDCVENCVSVVIRHFLIDWKENCQSIFRSQKLVHYLQIWVLLKLEFLPQFRFLTSFVCALIPFRHKPKNYPCCTSPIRQILIVISVILSFPDPHCVLKHNFWCKKSIWSLFLLLRPFLFYPLIALKGNRDDFGSFVNNSQLFH